MKRELSDAEWVLMKKLWETSPMTVTQLTAAVRDDTGWSKHTVISLLSRMEAKGAIGHRDGQRAKGYYPVLPKDDALRSETEQFLDRVFDGRVGLMMSAIMDSRALSRADIDELRSILDEGKGGEER